MKGHGIFTERDLLTHIVSDDFNIHDSVGKYSSSPMIVADVGIKVHDAASMMASKNIKRLGLVKNGLLVSIATARDVVDAYQSEYPVTNPYLEDLSEYISG
jgi:signal-transduction protein with cAMP-binding, CBS, and nucleotidyltransferase domain